MTRKILGFGREKNWKIKKEQVVYECYGINFLELNIVTHRHTFKLRIPISVIASYPVSSYHSIS